MPPNWPIMPSATVPSSAFASLGPATGVSCLASETSTGDCPSSSGAGGAECGGDGGGGAVPPGGDGGGQATGGAGLLPFAAAKLTAGHPNGGLWNTVYQFLRKGVPMIYVGGISMSKRTVYGLLSNVQNDMSRKCQ